MTYSTDNRSWLEPYIKDVALRMNLGHWRIHLSDEQPDDETDAQIELFGASRRGMIRIGDPDGDMEELRDCVVHELLHCHLHELEASVLQAEQHFNPPAFDLVRRNAHNQLEIAIHAIARGWSHVLPLPVSLVDTEDA